MAELGEMNRSKNCLLKVASYSWMCQNKNKVKIVEPGEMDQTVLTEAGIYLFFFFK